MGEKNGKKENRAADLDDGHKQQLPGLVNKRLMRNVALALVAVIVFFCFPNLVSGDCGHDHGVGHGHHHHHHDHEHISEPASFKWSREANEEHSHHSEQPVKNVPGKRDREWANPSNCLPIIFVSIFCFQQKSNSLIFGCTHLARRCSLAWRHSSFCTLSIWTKAKS